MTKMPNWTGKKSPTSQTNKEKHLNRVIKKILIISVKEQDWLEQKKDYDAHQQIQKQLCRNNLQD